MPHRNCISGAQKLLSQDLKNDFDPLASVVLISTNTIIFLSFLWAETHPLGSPRQLRSQIFPSSEKTQGLSENEKQLFVL